MFHKCCFLMLSLTALCTGSLYADSLQEDIDKSVQVVEEFKKIPEKGIPKSVLKNCKGVAILNVVKAAFFVSGRGGEGLVVAKTSDGWSAPSAVGVGGAGFGFQFGGEVTDFIIVLNNQEAIDAFSKSGNVELGVDVSVAAGPVGRTAEGGVMPVAAVYAYSLSRGVFAGISLEGTVLVERTKANSQFYKKAVSAKELLSGKISPPKSVNPLYDELNSYMNK
jgi:SH3 domain-containing YSC84-like protein 1